LWSCPLECCDLCSCCNTAEPTPIREDGFEATDYNLSRDQLGTQLDPPAHWSPGYPAIDELSATYALRPLIVIPIQDKVAQDPNYHLTVEDIQDWEKQYGRIPKGSVVFVRSDWSKEWPNPELAMRNFLGWGLRRSSSISSAKSCFTGMNRSIRTAHQILRAKLGT